MLCVAQICQPMKLRRPAVGGGFGRCFIACTMLALVDQWRGLSKFVTAALESPATMWADAVSARLVSECEPHVACREGHQAGSLLFSVKGL